MCAFGIAGNVLHGIVVVGRDRMVRRYDRVPAADADRR